MEPKRLSRILLDRGLVERFVLDQLLVKLKPDQTLADRLVADSVVSEADLLRAIAQATNTKFISSPRLADLKLMPQVLEMIPLAAAQANDVLPISFNAAAKSLTVVIADPGRLAALDDLPSVGKLDSVVGNVSMPGAIRAAIRRVYGLDRKPAQKAEPTPFGNCTQCQEPYFEDQLECANCGLLLNADAPTDNTEARIVRALLSQPSGLHRVPTRAQVHQGATRLGFAVPVTEVQIPQVVAGLDIARSLSEFEAFVISFVDGQMTVGELSQASGLMGIEVLSVVASLRERKILELRDAPLPPRIESLPPPAEPLPPPVEPPTPPVAHEPMPGILVKPRADRARPKSGTARPVPPAVANPPPPPVEAKKPDAPRPPAQKPAAEAPRPPAPKPALEGAKPRYLDPNVQMENSLQAALALERRGEVDGAIKVLRIAVSRAPNPAPLYNRLALVILNQRQDAQQAEELIQKAIELEPDNQVYRQNLFKVLSRAAIRR